MNSIATRQLIYRDEADREHIMTVQLGPPRPDDGFWACDYALGMPVQVAATAYGEDSLQALVLALHALRAHLLAPGLRDRVRWLDAPGADVLHLASLGLSGLPERESLAAAAETAP